MGGAKFRMLRSSGQEVARAPVIVSAGEERGRKSISESILPGRDRHGQSVQGDIKYQSTPSLTNQYIPRVTRRAGAPVLSVWPQTPSCAVQ